MFTYRFQRPALGLLGTLTLLLAACGGSDGPQASASAFAQQISSGTATAASLPGQASMGRSRILASGIAAQLDTGTLFDWAETQYPSLFPKGPVNQTLPYGDKVYTIRFYPSTQNYLGVADGNVYGLGAFTNNVVQGFGRVSDYTCQVSPSSCVTPPQGQVNECIDPAYANVQAGFRANLVYDYQGSDASGEQKLDIVVDGPGTFEGQSATQVSTTATLSFLVNGVPATTVSKGRSFQQPVDGGLWATLGSLNDTTSPSLTVGGITIPGSTTSTKVVYTPPLIDTEYTLQLGQSVTVTSGASFTQLAPTPRPPLASSFTRTYTFEAKESVTVFGRTFSTCRYRIAEGTNGTSGTTLEWLLLGKGVPVRSESTSNGKTDVIQLKSGSFNGVPI